MKKLCIWFVFVVWLTIAQVHAQTPVNADTTSVSTISTLSTPASSKPVWTAQDQKVLASFDTWVAEYLRQPAATLDSRSLGRGLDLAMQRREVFRKLIQIDPAKAVSLATSDAVRGKLPAAIAATLEIPVSGTGDLVVLAEMPGRGRAAVDPLRRIVKLNGTTYDAFIYGWRLGEGTKYGIPLHGVVVDGLLAVDDQILREVSLGESTAQSIIDLSGEAQSNAKIHARMGTQVYRLASRQHLQDAEARLEKSESVMGPKPTRPASEVIRGEPSTSARITPANATSSWTVGNKKVLTIRVDFSDLPGVPNGYGNTYSAAYVLNLANTLVNPYYTQSSYGQTSLTHTVSTLVYRMPKTANYYAVNGANDELHAAAETAASANYVVSSYDRVIVLFSNLGNITNSQITYGGLAVVGGTDVWVNGEFDFRVVAHELGHTYGLYHGNLWQVTDGNPVSSGGTSEEYSDDFDTMGANYSDDLRTDFNPWFKNLLGWIADSKVQTVTTSGTYRISRFDNSTGAGTILALKIVRDATHNYWIGCRRNFTTNLSMQNGAYIVWGYNFNQQSNLLDMTTPGVSDQDAALAVGATFNDTGISIHPVAEGGVSPDEYIDVQVTLAGAGRIIALSGNMNFGSVVVGTTKTSVLTISNTGSSTLSVSGISYPAGFSGSYSGNIPAGGSQAVTVTFAPTTAKAYSGNIVVNSNKTSGGNIKYASGTGISSSRIIVLSGNLNFGNVAVGAKKTSVMTISNTGSGTLSVSGIIYPTGFSGNWSGNIPAGGSHAVTVTFAPTVKKAYSGNVTVNSNKTSGGNIKYAAGTGI